MDVENELRKILFHVDETKFGKYYHKYLLKEYELYVNIADETSSRRDSANNLFIMINSALITLTGIFSGFSFCPKYISYSWIIISGVVGILICKSWKELISSYSSLNDGRYKIIHLLEEKLPAQVFKSEWEYLLKLREQKHKLLSTTELQIPNLFSKLYLFMIFIGILLLVTDYNIILNIINLIDF